MIILRLLSIALSDEQKRILTQRELDVSLLVSLLQGLSNVRVREVDFHHRGHRGTERRVISKSGFESSKLSLFSPSVPSVSSVVNSPLPQIKD